jgi:succinyl-CoA synthetase beta subunit
VKIHEYQAKTLFRSAGMPVPDGLPATTVDEAVAAAESLGYPVAVKAQVHAGGRGRAGGIRLADSRAQVSKAAGDMLGRPLQTGQTGSRQQPVTRVLIERGARIERELYLSVLPDRDAACLAIIASLAGGTDIEEVAAADPAGIIRIPVSPLLGAQPHHLRQAAFGLGLSGTLFKDFIVLLDRLYRLVVDKDLLLAEINPLAITADNRLLIVDAKVEVDPNALFRHPMLVELRDPDQEDPLEAEAARYNLNYIRLEGNIGNMVNGAGLAMATMDIIKKAGGEPANFLDVGGGASAEMIENGFTIILSDERVRGILINIFGGILRCDVLASGVVKAVRKTGLRVPVVVRMEGTNVEKGRDILADSGLDLIIADNLADAAGKIARIVGQG